MTKNCEIVLHPGMGEAVIHRLSEFAPIPLNGIVGGQAVASAISELFGDGRAVAYNDIDVFSPREELPQTQDKDIIHQRYALNVRRRKERVLEQSEFDLVTLVSGSYGDSFERNPIYRVERTLREGLLNKIECRFRIENIERYLVSSFDLNCVQVGVDLKTKALTWSKHFEQFLNTSEIEIINLSTPVHSLMRFFKKMKELQGVFGNKERMLELIAAAVTLDKNFDIHASPSSDLFGPVYKERFDDVASEILPYFNLTERLAQIPVYQLTPRFDVDRRFSEIVSVNSIRKYWLPTVAKVLHGNLKKGHENRLVHLLTQPVLRRGDVGNPLVYQLLESGISSFTGNISISEINLVIKTIADHPGLLSWFKSVSPVEQVSRAKLLRDSKTLHGMWIYGVLENIHYNHLELGGDWTAKVLGDILEEQKKLHSEKLLSKYLKPVVFEGFTVTELSRGLELIEEGAFLHHCVGGYSHSVKTGLSRIFSFRKDTKSQAITVELSKYKTSSWYIRSAHGLVNRNLKEDEELMVKRFLKNVHTGDFFGNTLIKLFGFESKILAIAYAPFGCYVAYMQKRLEKKLQYFEDIPF